MIETLVRDIDLAGKDGLLKSYPNPFSSEATILYRVPQDGHVILSVYNILGHRIKILKDGVQRAGSYELIWNARDDNGRQVPGGIFLCKIEVQNKGQSYSSVKRMMLMK
jgi:flagellar hook assembly protein FlgD